MTKNNSQFKLSRAFVYICLGIGLISLSLFARNILINKPGQELTKNPIPTLKPAENQNPNLKTYVSQKLKIKLSYLETQDSNFKVQIKEVGNKVYIYNSTSQPEQGQYIEVFTKNKNQSLADAIKNKFLSDHSPADCFVKLNPTYPDSTPINKNFNYAEISFPKNSDPNSQDPWWAKAEKCPQNYTTTNGISYFIEDRNQPDKFAYVSVGQYGISAGKNLNWQDTIEFVD